MTTSKVVYKAWHEWLESVEVNEKFKGCLSDPTPERLDALAHLAFNSGIHVGLNMALAEFGKTIKRERVYDDE